MALYNEILVGHFARGLQKLTGIKGSPPAVQLGADIVPVLPLPLGVEYKALDMWNRFSAFASATGGVAQFAGVRIRNPKNSGALAVIEKVLVGFAQADTINSRVDLSGAVEMGNGVALSVSFQGGLDSRSAPNPVSIVSTTVNFTGPLNTSYAQIRGAINTSYELVLTHNTELMLLPDMMFTLLDTTANVPIVVSLVWRERFFEESERVSGGIG